MPRPKGLAKTGGGPKTAQARAIAGVVRGHMMRAIAGLEDRGKGLTVLFEDALQKDVNATLTAWSRWIPKELLIDATVSQSIIDVLAGISETDDHEVEKEPSELRH